MGNDALYNPDIRSLLVVAREHAHTENRGVVTTFDVALAALSRQAFHASIEVFCGIYITPEYLATRALELGVEELSKRFGQADEPLHGVAVSRELLLALTHIESGLVLDDAPFRLDDLLEEALLLAEDNLLLSMLGRMGVNVAKSQKELRRFLNGLSGDPADLGESEPEVHRFPQYRDYEEYFYPSDEECGIGRGNPGEAIDREAWRCKHYEAFLRFAHDELRFNFEPVDDVRPKPGMALLVHREESEDIFVFGRNGKWHSMSNLHEYTDEVLRMLDHQMYRRTGNRRRG